MEYAHVFYNIGLELFPYLKRVQRRVSPFINTLQRPCDPFNVCFRSLQLCRRKAANPPPPPSYVMSRIENRVFFSLNFYHYCCNYCRQCNSVRTIESKLEHIKNSIRHELALSSAKMTACYSSVRIRNFRTCFFTFCKSKSNIDKNVYILNTFYLNK